MGGWDSVGGGGWTGESMAKHWHFLLLYVSLNNKQKIAP